MDKHPENRTQTALIVEQIESLARECLRMAERIVLEGRDRLSWESQQAREQYTAMIPAIAMDLKNHMGGAMAILQNASTVQIDRIYEVSESVLSEIRKRNEAVGK